MRGAWRGLEEKCEALRKLEKVYERTATGRSAGISLTLSFLMTGYISIESAVTGSEAVPGVLSNKKKDVSSERRALKVDLAIVVLDATKQGKE